MTVQCHFEVPMSLRVRLFFDQAESVSEISFPLAEESENREGLVEDFCVKNPKSELLTALNSGLKRLYVR